MHCFHFTEDSGTRKEYETDLVSDVKSMDEARSTLNFEIISQSLKKCLQRILEQPSSKSMCYKQKVLCTLQQRLDQQRSAILTLQVDQINAWKRIMQLCENF